MIGKTGIWSKQEAQTHAFSYYTAKYIGDYFEKDRRVIDLGCGNGTYCGYLKDRGFFDVIGIDGLPGHDFDVNVSDLSKPLPDWVRKGNVLSIEVFEHIPKEHESQFVDNICSVCDNKLVLSVAVKGQPGLGHVNCQDNAYIVDLFERKGFVFQIQRTAEIRANVESHVDYLRNTLMVFERV